MRSNCGPSHHPYMRMGPMHFMQGDFKKIAGHFMKQFEGWVPYDLSEYEDYYLISVPLPGLAKDHVEVSLISGNINIKATRPEKEDEDKKVKPESTGCCELPRGFLGHLSGFIWEKDVNLEIPLPSNANEESIKSKMSNGLLKIKIGKNPPKNINIDTSSDT